MALGSVSIVPYTRAEVKQMLKQATYPNGKVVWSQGIGVSASITVPEEVDYITAGYGDKTYTVARGGSQSWEQTITGSSPYNWAILTYTLRFDKDGTFRTSWSRTQSSGSISVSGRGSYTLTGYHYY